MSTFRYQNSTRPPTLKQQHFLEGYQKHGNATRAARDAGFSEKHAASAGHRLLQHPLVKETLKQAAPIFEEVSHQVELPSGLQVSFSYKGRPVAPSIALAISQAGGSPAELDMWRSGHAVPADAGVGKLRSVKLRHGSVGSSPCCKYCPSGDQQGCICRPSNSA